MSTAKRRKQIEIELNRRLGLSASKEQVNQARLLTIDVLENRMTIDNALEVIQGE